MALFVPLDASYAQDPKILDRWAMIRYQGATPPKGMDVLPFEDLAQESRDRIQRTVFDPEPPPATFHVGAGNRPIAELPSRAFHEWHWARSRGRRRPSIPDSLRQAVYVRDGHACRHCGATGPLSLDHVIPYSLGGPDTYENFQTLCRPCNSRKGARV